MNDQRDDVSVVLGAGGGIGRALASELRSRGERVIALSRTSDIVFDVTSPPSIRTALDRVFEQGVPRRIILSTGFLHDDRFAPERSLREMDADHMTQAFQINTIGPALVLRSVLELMPRSGVFGIAALSARVGSISDNRLGGWLSYRASKAALNQVVRTASIEMKRRNRDSVCVALHPGTVDTALSQPFSKRGLDVRPPALAAREIVDVMDGLTPSDTGGFFDHTAQPIAF
ncbi:SDR family NAD(P)-dependent oxidoreductase [Maricaulis sp. D1M11]|uniref:SDR family NAD(P)-dependent oxidoreductase n=1 Tax=Maricaulis sp. D1M11 TaxID=3076117 RepID=UPI0039B5DF07